DVVVVEFLGQFLEALVDVVHIGVVLGVIAARGKDGLHMDVDGRGLLLDLLEDFAVAGFYGVGLAAAAEVVDTDEEQGVAGIAIEDRFVHAAEDAAFVGIGESVTDDVGTDAAVEDVAIGKIFVDVEAFGDAVAEENDVFLGVVLLVLVAEGIDAIDPMLLEEG